jgi:hypothetical protein
MVFQSSTTSRTVVGSGHCRFQATEPANGVRGGREGSLNRGRARHAGEIRNPQAEHPPTLPGPRAGAARNHFRGQAGAASRPGRQARSQAPSSVPETDEEHEARLEKR